MKKRLKRVKLSYKGNKFHINSVVCTGLREALGLVFKRKERAKALLFEFEKPTTLRIHSFFVFFPFIAIWVSEKGRIIDFKVVRPFTPSVSPKRPFTKLIEVPLNKEYARIIKVLVGDRKV